MGGCQNGVVFVRATKSLMRPVLNKKLHKTPNNWEKFSSRGSDSLKLDIKSGKNRHEIYPFFGGGCQNGVLYFDV